MAEDAVSFTVRNLPKPLHAALTKLAAANRRSINAEVVTAIEGHVAANATRKTALSIAKVISTPTADEAPTQEVVDLMDALRASLNKRVTKRAKGKQ